MKKPNILMILSDQHRYDSVGTSGMYPVQTPHLDALAASGVWFENAYTPLPTCCPARQALLTCRRPESYGGYWNYDITLPIYALEPTEYSWVRDLSENGYITGFMGKWHVNPDHYADEYGYNDVVDADREHQSKHGPRYEREKFAWGGWEEERPYDTNHTAYITDRAKGKLQEYAAQEKPWLLSVHFDEPHPPAVPHKDFAKLYDAGKIPQWAGFADEFENKPYIQKQQLLSWGMEDYTWEDWAPTVARYYALVTQLDDAVGKILAQLKVLNMEEDTIVIYTSDHGDMCGSHRMFDKHYVLYEDTIHVPMVWKFGSRFAQMRTSAYSMNCLDIGPTLLELAGVPCTAQELHGRSLVPVLEGNTPEDWPGEAVSTYNGQQFGLYTQRCIKTNQYKYIWNLTDIDEFYDLQEDPGELRNLIDEPALGEKLKELRQRLYNILKEQKDPLCCRQNGWAADSQLKGGRKLGRCDKLPLKM